MSVVAVDCTIKGVQVSVGDRLEVTQRIGSVASGEVAQRVEQVLVVQNGLGEGDEALARLVTEASAHFLSAPANDDKYEVDTHQRKCAYT